MILGTYSLNIVTEEFLKAWNARVKKDTES